MSIENKRDRKETKGKNVFYNLEKLILFLLFYNYSFDELKSSS
jgi:hypothetical protein